MPSPDLVGKRLELLREVFLALRRLAILGNAGYPAAASEMVEAGGRVPGLLYATTEGRRSIATDLYPVRRLGSAHDRPT